MTNKLLSIFFAMTCPALYSAEVKLVGGLQPARTVQFNGSLNLIEALDGTKSITCSNVTVSRKQTRFVIDLTGLLANPKADWPLQDGDIISMPEHVIGCLGASDEAAFISLFHDYTQIRKGGMVEPADWLQRVKKLPTHWRDPVPENKQAMDDLTNQRRRASPKR